MTPEPRSSKIRIMLVEDNAAYRKVIDRGLANEPDMELISQFGSAEFALRSLQDMSTRKVPDLILLDLNLPGISGLDALPEFKQSIPDTHIIVLTQSDKEADILQALSAGASGYLLKASTLDQLTDGIRTVMNGGASIDPGMAIYLLNTLKTRPSKKTEENQLSERELEILTLISEGRIKKEIAAKLKISPRTVENHVRHIYAKLQVPNAPAAVAKAFKTGLLHSKK